MKKAPVIGILAVLLVGVIAVGTFAFPFGEKGQGEGMLYSNEAAKTAIETGDYDAFVSAMQANSRQGKLAELTEEQFNDMVERNKERNEKMKAMQETRDAIHNALESGDYDAWHTAVSSIEPTPELAEKITKDNFGTYLQLHQAKEGKDWETAKALAEELGLERPGLGINGGRGIGPRDAGMGQGFKEMQQGRHGGMERTGQGIGHRTGEPGQRAPPAE